MIYILEDDDGIRNFTQYALEASDFEVRGFACPSQFWEALGEAVPDLLLLDIMLPGEDGLSVLSKLRAQQETASLPVILMTAKGSEYDKVVGLDAGADDYVTKPFGVMELIARIKALLRRARGSCDDAVMRFEELSIDPSARSVKSNGEEIVLTLKEFDLLVLLARNVRRVLTRDMILESVWGYDYDGENRTVDVHVRTLRQKLGESGRHIDTVRGVGYRLI